MLWNAKMRFGKTLSALEVVRRLELMRTIIVTHRPVVEKGWFEDFGKIFYDTDYTTGSKNKASINDLEHSGKNYIYFASIQDLRGSTSAGGVFEKNDEVFDVNWDLVIIDEAHEGTKTKRGEDVLALLTKKETKVLKLSGTPFNLIADFQEKETYTWDYVMEQQAKADWDIENHLDPNPYSGLPRLNIFTYELNELLRLNYEDVEDKAFNFREFFKTEEGEFVHKNDVKQFLDLLAKKDDKSNYPFSTEEYRDNFRHSFWIMPGVKEAKALCELLREHSVFKHFDIVNVAGNEETAHPLKEVESKIGNKPEDTYTITVSCGKLTTGVSIPAWTAVLYLAGSAMTSATNYLQTIFRVQTPANIGGKVKEECYVFDFAPDRTLKVLAEAGQLSHRAGETGDEKQMGEFLNFCPVIAINGSGMKDYNVSDMLQQLKRIYVDRVARNGFDDPKVYNDNLHKLDDIELNMFKELEGIIGKSKQAKKVNEIDVNQQGFTDEEYQVIKSGLAKPKQQRTPEEMEAIKKYNEQKKQAQTAISILRGISIRIPLMIYGADIPIGQDVTVENFTEIIDDKSWEEFMPKGVTKEKFKEFDKYYDKDIFIAAGRKIRNRLLAAQELPITERVGAIAEIFSTFKNPDKETVLTPWRVVNMHIGDTLGGYNFYDENYKEILEDPRMIIYPEITANTLFNNSAIILEINSKTGLYPLYCTYSIYRQRLLENNKKIEDEEQMHFAQSLWDRTLDENIYVIAKTKMARSITQRTLAGFSGVKTNIITYDDILDDIRKDDDTFKNKILSGATWGKKEWETLNIDAVVGNPPYQETIKAATTGNNANTVDVFPYFQKGALEVGRINTLIYPAKELQRGKMDLLDQRLIKVRIYNGSNKEAEKNIPGELSVFGASVRRIPGDVGVFLWDTEAPTEQVKYQNIIIDRTDKIMPIRKEFFGLAIKFKENADVFEIGKIRKCCESNFVAEHPTSVLSNVESRLLSAPLGYTKVLTNDKAGSGGKATWFYIKTEDLDFIQPAEYKVVIGSAFPNEGFNNPKNIEILKPDEMFGRTKMSLYSSANKIDAENFKIFTTTNFVKTIVQMTPLKFLYYLPNFDDIKSDIDWSKSITEIDNQLYAKYDLSEEEITFIESRVRSME